MKERKESEEVSERDGFEDTHIVRLEQDMVTKDSGTLQEENYSKESKRREFSFVGLFLYKIKLFL